MPPSQGDFFVVVDFTLQNVGASRPLPTSLAFLSLDTTQAFVITSSPYQPSGACGAAVSLGTGGHIECQVAFEVPAGQTPATLVYDDRMGDKASAPLPSLPPPATACETIYGWIGKSPSSTCLSCLQSATGAACAASAKAYSAACTSCNNVCGTGQDFCTCERGCDSASCQSLFDAEASCLESACSNSCP
jgi:hypothetical protein